MRLCAGGESRLRCRPLFCGGTARTEKNMAARKIGSKQAFTLMVLSILLAFSVPSAVAMQCEKLSELKLENAAITSAQLVTAGAFELPGTMPNPAMFKELPAFCRVTLEIKPSKDSDIKAEVWLPVTGW